MVIIQSWSFIARSSDRQSPNEPHQIFEPTPSDLQYLNPTAHSRIAKEIANYGREKLAFVYYHIYRN